MNGGTATFSDFIGTAIGAVGVAGARGGRCGGPADGRARRRPEPATADVGRVGRRGDDRADAEPVPPTRRPRRYMGTVQDMVQSLLRHDVGVEVAMRVTQSMMSAQVQRELQAALAAIARQQERISSGRRILVPADDPAGAAQAVAIRSRQAAARTVPEQYGDGPVHALGGGHRAARHRRGGDAGHRGGGAGRERQQRRAGAARRSAPRPTSSSRRWSRSPIAGQARGPSSSGARSRPSRRTR